MYFSRADTNTVGRRTHVKDNVCTTQYSGTFTQM